MNKIKEKLTGNSSSSHDDSNKLSKNEYGSNTTGTTSSPTSKLQNPISSSGGTTGTYANQSPPSSYPQQNSGYTSNASDRDGYSSHNQTGSYPEHSSGHTSMKDRLPGGHSNHQERSSYPQNTGGYTSTSNDRMAGSYGNNEHHSSSGPRQPFDPYSSKGQETAARAETTGYGNNQTQNYSRPTAEDSMSHGRDGGVTNQYSDQRHGAPHTSSRDHESSSHYGRDATMAGGAGGVGAGGISAYDQNQSSSQPLAPGQQHNVQHMDRDSHPMGSNTSTGNNMPGESPGMTQAKKMGGA